MSAPRLARLRAALRDAPEGAAPLALTAFSAAALGAGLGRALLTTYLPVLLERIRDAPGLIGTVMLVNVAAGLLVPPAAGVWSDRLRARGHGRTLPFVLGGSLLASGGLLAVALGTASSYLVLAVVGGVGYVGLNCLTTAHRALIVEGFSDEARARATAAEELAMLLGGLAGIAVGGLLVDARPWAPFAIGALALPVLAVPTVLRMRRRERPAVAPAERERHAFGSLRRAARRPVARRVLVAQGLWVVGYAPLPAFFVLYARHELGLTTAGAAAWLIGFGVVTGLAMLAAGASRDPARHAPLLRIGVTLLGGGLAGIAVASSPAAAAPGLAAAAAGFGLVSTVGFPLLASSIPSGEAGTYTALYFSVRSLAGAVALPAAGWAIDLTGSYRALPAAGAAATLLALVPLAGMGGRRAAVPSRLRDAGRVLGAVTAATGVVVAAGVAVAATPLEDLDRRLFRAINAHGPGSSLLDRLVIDPTIRNYLILGGIAAAAAAIGRSGRVLESTLAAGLAGGLSFGLVRAAWVVWDRQRPQEALPDVTLVVHDFAPHSSFPSGHVAVTVAMVVTITLLHPRLRAPLWSFVAVMGFTRILSGAHFPSDVLLAIPLGIASAHAALRLVELALPGRARLAPQPSAAISTRAESTRGRNELRWPS